MTAADSPDPLARSWRSDLVAGATFFVAAVVLQLVRQPGTRVWNTIWAEDGEVYVTEAYHHPAVLTVLRGYAGYVQLLPRLVAMPVRLLPVGAVAPYLALAATGVTAVLALLVYRWTSGWVASPWSRWLIAVMAVLAPVVVSETNANIANLGWPLLFASFWAFMAQSRGRWDTAARAAVVALTALSNPVVGALVPLAIIVVVVRRRRDDVIVAAALCAALVVQLVAAHFTAPGPSGDSHLGDLPTAFGVRVGGSLVFGERWLGDLWSSWDLWLIAVAAAILLAYLALARAWRMPTSRWCFAIAGALGSVLLFVVPVWLRGTDRLRVVTGDLNGQGARYVVVPLLLLFSVLVVIVDGSGRRWLQAILVAHMTVLLVTGFGRDNLRSLGPAWSTEVRAARQQCEREPARADVEIVISPPGGWFVDAPCGRLG